jgi:DNA-binding NarL/FixJ family response regulator
MRNFSLRVLYVGGASHLSLARFKESRRVSTLRAALAIIRTEKFDLIIVDRNLEDGDGIVLAPTIRRIHPHTISILLTEPRGWATTEAAQQLGYFEIIEGAIGEEEFTSRIEKLIAQQSPPQAIATQPPSRTHLLSLREREILMDLATGATTEEIALKRHNSIATIKSHITSIYRKLGVRNRVEAVSQINS